MSETPPIRVAISGGSIGGLCAGVALQGIGAEVHVFERQTAPMSSRGAGIVVQRELTGLLLDHNAPVLRTTGCSIRRYLEPSGGEGRTQRMPQRFTSWEAIYKTLRSTLSSPYHMDSLVTGFESNGAELVVSIDGRGDMVADLLVCADGAASPSRQKFLPDIAPSYAGYVAWRGTLDEADAPQHLVSFFDDTFTFSEARAGGHMLAYLIPGENADPSPGKRRLNWVWYVPADEDCRDRLMIDRDGHQHHSSLPQGLAPEETVQELRSEAYREVHPMMAELLAATPDPFIQSIFDITVPQTCFGRAILLGDAAFVIRPHTAAAAAKAAYDASVLAQALRFANGDIDARLRIAEEQQLALGRELSRYGQALGNRWAQPSLKRTNS